MKTNKLTSVSLFFRAFAIFSIVLSVSCNGWADQTEMSVTQSDMVINGLEGGPFEPNSFVYTITNNIDINDINDVNDSRIGYIVKSDQPWVLIDNVRGFLLGNETVNITISLAPEVDSFADGQYSANVKFINRTGHSGDTSRDLSLTILKIQHSWDMNSDPGWAMEKHWAWGRPKGLGGAYGEPDPKRGYTGRNVLGFNLNGDYFNYMRKLSVTTNAIDCLASVDTQLRFRRWLGVESNIYDHARIQVSNNAINWKTIWKNPDTIISESSWSLQSYDISQIADEQSTVYIRWSLGPTDESWRYCGWNIDDVEILGITQPITQRIVNISNRVAPQNGTIGPFDIIWTNNTSSEYDLDAIPYIYYPNEPPVQLDEIPVIFAAGDEEIILREITFTVPLATDPGRYRYEIELTDPNNGSILDLDGFNYRVIPDPND